MIRVLVVDDSFLMRKMLSDMLSSDPAIEVVGTAADGLEALAQVKQLDPDVITMDLEMAKMDGLTATKRILEDIGPKPIIIVSAYTPEHADAALACLSAGAFSCIAKPSGPLSLDIQNIQDELIKTVKIASARKGVVRMMGERRHKQEKLNEGHVAAHAPSLVIIGSSTGGPPVVEEILSQIPSECNVAIVVVQHMPMHFTKSFAERLDRVSGIKVKEAECGEVMKPGVALVAPGDHNILLRKHADSAHDSYAITCARDTAPNLIQPNIDLFMESAAQHFEGRILGIILTGMGEDGTKGMQAIKRAGGKTIVQDPATCVVDSMVQSVMHKGVADEVLTPDLIARRIVQWLVGGIKNSQ